VGQHYKLESMGFASIQVPILSRGRTPRNSPPYSAEYNAGGYCILYLGQPLPPFSKTSRRIATGSPATTVLSAFRSQAFADLRAFPLPVCGRIRWGDCDRLSRLQNSVARRRPLSGKRTSNDRGKYFG
jgi:hypothetical protein